MRKNVAPSSIKEYTFIFSADDQRLKYVHQIKSCQLIHTFSAIDVFNYSLCEICYRNNDLVTIETNLNQISVNIEIALIIKMLTDLKNKLNHTSIYLHKLVLYIILNIIYLEPVLPQRLHFILFDFSFSSNNRFYLFIL